jgi:outer membrane protein assembly factor BamA
MSKLKYLIWVPVIMLCIYSSSAICQNSVKTETGYKLLIKFVDKDSSFKAQTLGLNTSFSNKEACLDYIFTIPSLLTAKGYPTASVDTVYFDSSSAHINLFLGRKYYWAEINTDSVDKRVLDAVGWNKKFIQNKKTNLDQIEFFKQSIINYYGRTGYPFAKVQLDSIRISDKGDGITAKLKVNKSVLYHIDSIHVYGKLKIKNSFLQHYLGIPNGSVYNNDKLQLISKKLSELQYLQEQQRWDLNMLGTGSILNLYLQPKRSSQVDVLVGVAPASTVGGKAQISGNVNLNLKNSLGYGETIALNWQQLQKQSPKLNIGYQHPYIFNFPFGVDLSFDLYKKDSAYVQLNGRIGIQYTLSATRSMNIFYQAQRTFLLSGGYDTNQIRINKVLPQNIDVTANNIGIEYNYSSTNYRYNPRKGNELSVFTTIGLKKITRNNDIINLKDPGNPSFNFNSLYDSLKPNSYQFNIHVIAAHYFPSGKRSTFKTSLNTGIFQSPFIFKNELFRIGGYKLLRGFDEESIYANKYAVFTGEFRYLTGLNSFIYLFSDIGFTGTHFQSNTFSNNFQSFGLGLSFETKVGILNVAYAIGNRNDVNFNFRQASKIHFGYINYF